jgi:hypothetical protein
VPLQVFVVSDPPHPSVQLDAVAGIFRLDPADARLKVDFPAPEVLNATDPDHATAFAASLTGAGMNVKTFDSAALARIPWPAPVSSFEFGVDGLVADVSGRQVTVGYAVPILGVYCAPPAGFMQDLETGLTPPTDGVGIAEAIQSTAVLDLYFRQGGDLQRLSLVRGVTDFSRLADTSADASAETPPSESVPEGNGVGATAAECERRFSDIEIDARLLGVLPRRRFAMGDDSFDPDIRKNFSYGTLLLRQALYSVRPDLGDLTQWELGSRIALVLGGATLGDGNVTE